MGKYDTIFEWELLSVAYTKIKIYRVMRKANRTPDFPFRFSESDLEEQKCDCLELLVRLKEEGMMDEFSRFLPDEDRRSEEESALLSAIRETAEAHKGEIKNADELFKIMCEEI